MPKTPEPSDLQALVEALGNLKGSDSAVFDTATMWRRVELRLADLPDELTPTIAEGPPPSSPPET